MLKLIKRLFFTVMLTIIGLIGYKVFITPEMITPFPYKVESRDYFHSQQARQAQVLIIGDRMGKALEHYQKPLTEIASEGLRNPLNVFNWSAPGEGIHRSVEKLKYLADQENLPKIIVYQGGSEEFYEKRFNLEKSDHIKKNFELYSQDWLSSGIMLLPWLSRFFYYPFEQKPLGPNFQKDSHVYSTQQRQLQMEMIFKFYEHHLKEMISLARAHDSTLILTTTPINLEEVPKKTCPNTQTQEIQSLQNEVVDFLEKGQYKRAYSKAQNLIDISTGNAQSSYLFGKAALRNGQRQQAREAFTHAAAVDCEPWRINPVFNSIVSQQAAKNDLFFIDFNKMINQNIGQDVLFLSSLYPQHVFYQQFIQILAREIRLILQL